MTSLSFATADGRRLKLSCLRRTEPPHVGCDETWIASWSSCLLLVFLVWLPCAARAHTPSETFLSFFLTPTNIAGQWDVAIRDLQAGVKVDPARWDRMTPPERDQQLEGFAIDTITRLNVKADGRLLVFRVTDLETVSLKDQDYARVRFAAGATGAATEVLEINGGALFAVDTNLHGLLRVEHDGRTETASFNAERPGWNVKLKEASSRGAQAWTFVREGTGHIWQGPDHILFLLALLLPAVLRREDGAWKVAESFRAAAINIVKIVTAFTVAHSITLSLAALDIVRVPGRVVEPIIAASVIAAAANNLRPWFGERGWLVAFGFGLVHGLGLAGGLIDFGLRGAALALALVGFNVGVELGQLAIVAAFLPLTFALRKSWFYQTAVFKFGSGLVIVVAAVWMAERVFNFKLLA